VFATECRHVLIGDLETKGRLQVACLDNDRACIQGFVSAQIIGKGGLANLG
jgi:hypothetical protein